MTTLTAGVHKIREIHGLNVALWTAQVILIGVFGMTGVMKTFVPISELAQSIAWTGDVPVAMVRFIGICEIAGVLGLILPPVMKALPGYLTPAAAIGLMLVMLSAMGFHTVREEMGPLPLNLVLGSIAAFLAWGRFTKYPTHPHT
jgi:uncharacterized membrane protein YphA (DoxX/SURF4 family)